MVHGGLLDSAASGAERGQCALRWFRQYPAYKDSGIEWLRELPAHWEVKPLKHLTAFFTGWTPPSGRDDLYGGGHLWANIGDLGPRILHRTETTIADKAIREARLTIVKAGSLLFSFKLSVGTVSIAGMDMYTNEAIAGFEPSERIDTHLYWAAPVLVPRNAQENIYGAPLLSRERIANARLPNPPRKQQRGIAAFLDRETARIDALVAQKEQLIALLQEKRTALMTRAVTKGLDPNVPMKDSGVEWLGQIPVHWEVKPLKRLFANLDSRRVPLAGEERAAMAKEYPYSGASGVIDHVESYLFDEPLILVAEDGANLYSRSTPLAFVAVGRYWVNNHAHILRPMDGMVTFWAHVLGCIVFDPWISGSAQPKLTSENLGSITLPVPPSCEREEIVAFADRSEAQVGYVMAKASEAIDRLKELRTALISAAVTGKIDVRQEVT